MKKFILIISAFLLFFVFSCASDGEIGEEQPELAGTLEGHEPDELSGLADGLDEESGDEIALPGGFQDEIKKDEIGESDPNLPALPDVVETQTAQVPPEPEPEPTPEEESTPVESLVLEQQAVPEPALPTSPASPTPPRQTPPLPPPALLGPAEERVRETPPSPVRESPAVTAEPPAPSRSVTAVPPPSEEIIFSRTVRATVGQLIEIPFRGTGWVYLGELASRRGVVYNSRRLDPDGQSFVFRAEEAGTYALKFSREDFIRDYILNDHVQVIVGEAPGGSAGWFNPPYDHGRVVAEPRWPSALNESERRSSLSGLPSSGASSAAQSPAASPASESNSERSSELSSERSSELSSERSSELTSTSAEQTGQPAQTTAPAAVAAIPGRQGELPPSSAQSEPSLQESSQTQPAQDPQVLLQRAKESFDGGNAAAAIALLDQYKGYFPSGTDELYWLYGQFYEANTPSRNILLSLDYYRRLTDEYPQSSRYNDARRRIAYLERFYINIQ